MFKRVLTVLPSDSSCFGTIKLRSLLDYFQDTASIAVNDIEGTPTELAARGYAWVLAKYEIDFVGTLPLLDELFSIQTFHDPNHGFNCLRAFQAYKSDGKPFAFAKTSWLLLDLAAQRLVRPAVHLPEILSRDNEAISPDFQSIPVLRDANEGTIEINQTAKFHDLDNNSHVNNAVYFEWVFEASPVDLMTHELRSVRASFRSGVKWGEKIKICIEEISGKKGSFVYNIFNLSRENNSKPSAAFLCCWEERKEV